MMRRWECLLLTAVLAGGVLPSAAGAAAQGSLYHQRPAPPSPPPFFRSPALPQHLAHVALLVHDYDEAKAYFTERLGFRVVEDTPLSATKRWLLVVPPGDGGTALLLARAATPEQAAAVGRQGGGRVFLFLHTDDFRRDYEAYRARGVAFVETPREESYGTVVVFEDLYGNRWDLVQRRAPAPPPPPPALETARLRLRAFVPTDAPAVQRLAGDRRIADTTLTVPHPYPDGAAEAWIATHAPAWTAGTQLTYAVTARGDGTLLGAVGLALKPAHAAAELGYWIAVPEWGKGYATEAAATLCDHAFAVLGTHRIQARHLLRNPASGRVMQKLGMRQEGVMRGALRKWDRFEDVALYAVLAPEWRATDPASLPRGG